MKRKMIGAASAYIAGLFFASFFTGIHPLALPAAAALIILIGRLRSYSRYDYFIIAGFFVLGAVLSFGRNSYITNAEKEYKGESFTFTGTVEDISRYDGGNVMYTLKGRAEGKKTLKVRLFANDTGAEFGDSITAVNCMATFPESDYLYDTERSFRAAGISFTISSADKVYTGHTGRKPLKNAAAEYREKLTSKMRIALGDEVGGFLAGMVFGKRQSLDEETRTALYRSGIGHVLAVSGLHISIIAAAVMSLCRFAGAGRFKGLIITDAAVLIMILLADSPVSAVRAAIMMNFLYAAPLFRRQNDTFNSLAAAVLLIGLADPKCVYSSGFILSVAGTFGIGFFGPYMTRNFPKDTYLQRLLRQFIIMLCTAVFIMPFSMKFFGETSLISPVTNIVLMPFCGAALILGVLYVFSFGLLPVLPAAGAMIKTVLIISDKLTSAGGTWFSCGSDRIVNIAFFLMSAAVLVFIVSGSRRYTAFAAAMGCSLVFLSSAIYGARMHDTFTVAVLGKGNNAAVVITHKGRTEVIDLTGDYRSPEYVRKFLSSNDIYNIDSLVLTKDVQAQYSAYSSALGGTAPDVWSASGDTPVFCGDYTVYMGSGGYLSETSDRQTEYSEGILTISHAGKSIVLASASERGELPVYDLLILYGNPPKDRPEHSGEVIYLDKKEENSMNDFTVTISGNGSIRERRL